jgi:hypothetical protein
VLHLFDLGAGFVLDLLAQLEHFRFARQDADQLAQLLGDRIDLQQRLGFGQLHALEVGDGIDDLQRVVDGEMEVTSSRGKEGIISAMWVNWSRALRASASISRPSSTVSGPADARAQVWLQCW